ncbi:MAG: sensor histidine kinase [Alphaproteobacteria bacterium]
MFRSLKFRLLIVFALVLVFTAAAAWALVRVQAQRLASNLQDENLAAMAFGFFSSVTASAGSWVTPEEVESFFPRDLDQYYYRLIGPQGAYISGYNFVQVPVPEDAKSGIPYFADFMDNSGEKFRGISLILYLDQPDYPGWVTLQVAQSTRGQLRLIDEQMRAFRLAAIGIILIALAAAILLLLVAFRPLQQLTRSVAQRGRHDLSPIRQVVPGEVQPLKDRLNGLFTDVQEAQLAKDRVIGNAAHQLRTPLTAIRLNANLAATQPEPASYIDQIDKEAENAAQLTESLLKLEHVTDLSQGENTDSSEICQAVYQDWEPTLRRNGIEPEFQTLGSRKIQSSSALLAEVLNNLFDNVIKHSQANRMRLVCSQDSIEFSDNGVGVEKDELEFVGERFFKGKLGSKQGHGLGMAIAKEFSARFGASLEPIYKTDGFLIRIEF